MQHITVNRDNMGLGCPSCMTIWSIGDIAFNHHEIDMKRNKVVCQDCSYKLRRAKLFKLYEEITERIKIVE